MKILFPYWDNDNKSDGLLMEINSFCKKCESNACKNIIKPDNILECSYGFNYIHSDNIVYFGILLYSKEYTKFKKNKMYNFPYSCINQSIFEKYLLFNREIATEIDTQIQKEKETIINDYIKNNKYKEDYLSEIKKNINESFSFFHDYQQINSTIIKNINVIILEKSKSDKINDEALLKCNQNEVAIYYASQILEEKLNTAKAMKDFTWINRIAEDSRFSIYGCILKYVRMYKTVSDLKNIQVSLTGSCFYEITKNPKAFSIIPHTLIDNAIKYSPKNEKIAININEELDYIFFSVKSLGPKIEDNEIEKIFSPFYRGQNARIMEEEGSGYGLHIAQRVAQEYLNTNIEVNQNISKTKEKRFFETVFSIKIPKT
jgi:signal transduction histidine kinase